MKHRWVIHKPDGTVRLVHVEAERMHLSEEGTLSFWNGPQLVMAYSPHAWRSCSYEGTVEDR